jgi:hypothetical protein
MEAHEFGISHCAMELLKWGSVILWALVFSLFTNPIDSKN